MDFVKDLFNLEGKTAVVIGGSGAIGMEMSCTLMKAGARVILWGRSSANLDSAAVALENDTGSTCTAMQVDAGSEDQVQQALAATTEKTGPVHILVNCAGGNMGRSSLAETDLAQFRSILEANLMAGLMVPTKVFADNWIDNRIEGSIINLASMTSYKPLSGVLAYDAAKAGVLNLTQAAAAELAEHGIRVNAIAPGFFVGKQNRDLLFQQGTDKLTERGESIISRTPYRRFGRVEELAGATLFLASTAASGFVTGVTIPVDGGFLVDNI